METTRESISGRLYLSEFTIPKGTKVRELTPEECPTARGLWVVADPRDIPEFHTNPILRHDLTHRYAFVTDRVISQ